MRQKNPDDSLTVINSPLLLEHTYKKLHAPLYFYAFKFVKDEEVSRDLVQDSFLSVLNKPLNNTEIFNLPSYLFRTVRNNCLNYLHHKSIEHDFQEMELERSKREIEYFDMYKALVENEMVQKLNEAIETLPEHYRLPFVMSRFENVKNKEIAEKLGIPLRTVETKIYRALCLLREKMGDCFISFYVIILRHKP
ncbi:MAG: RNA polymerase sigma-70 factor [Mangrovibacterium sp.]